MSMIIKGMKKPESCVCCPLQFGGFCAVAPAWVEGRVAPTVEEAAKQKYPKWCPMVDANDMREEIVSMKYQTQSESDYTYGLYRGYSQALDVIDRYLQEVQK